MLSLTYANRTERLLAELAEALREEREAFGLWEPLQLVVPNPNVKRYLLDGLGRALGILANVQVDYLDGLWRRPLERYLAGNGEDLKLMQLAEKAAGLLEDYSLTRPEWAAAWPSMPASR